MSLPPELPSDVAENLARALELGPDELGRVRATRLSGLTNLVYRIDTSSGSCVVRLAGSGTDRFIDRRAESANHRTAAGLGLAPPIVYSEPDAGTLVTRFVEGASTVSPAALQLAPVRTRLARSLHALHDSDVAFVGETDLAAELDRYSALLETALLDPALLDPAASHLSHLVAAAVAPAREAARRLSLETGPRVPCHNDPAPSNMLDDGDRIWFVDWEYAGTNDPAWDLATAMLEGDLSRLHAEHLLAQYYGREPTRSERDRVDLHRVGLDALAGLWALAQDGRDDSTFDFVTYARRRIDRAQASARVVLGQSEPC